MVCGSRVCLLLVILCSSVFCDDCVTYNFEDDFESQFNPNTGRCAASTRFWTLNSYSSSVQAPNNLSSVFISPEVATEFSCTASFEFSMTIGGFIEMNVFTENAQMTDQITALVLAVSGATLGTLLFSPLDPSFVSGWQTLRIDLGLPAGVLLDGYIILMGMASANSVILVDSFRYVPPYYNEEECIIYKENNEIVTDAPVTTPGATTDDNVEEVSTGTEPWTTTAAGGDNSTITESPSTPAVTDDNGGDIELPVTQPSTTAITDDGSDESGPSITESWMTTVTDDDTDIIEPSVTPWITTAVTDDNIIETDPPITEPWTTANTDDDESESPVTEASTTSITEDTNSESSPSVSESYTTSETGPSVTNSYTTAVTDDYTGLTIEQTTPETGLSTTEWTTDDGGATDTSATEVYTTAVTDDSEGETGSTISELSTTAVTDNNEDSPTTSEPNTTAITGGGGGGTDPTFPELSTSPVTDTTEYGESSTTTEPYSTTITDAVTGTKSSTSTTPRPTDNSSFWNPLTIAMVVILSLILLIIICVIFYELGKNRGREKRPAVVIQEFDYDALPKPLTVPRVTRVYSENEYPFRNSALPM